VAATANTHPTALDAAVLSLAMTRENPDKTKDGVLTRRAAREEVRGVAAVKLAEEAMYEDDDDWWLTDRGVNLHFDMRQATLSANADAASLRAIRKLNL